MKRHELEHVIRAAAATADVRDVVIIGSQAILGTVPDAPAEFTQSMEADVFPRDAPERALLIDGAIGELSLFHQTFGYYAHGVDETTAVLPENWRERLVKLENDNTMGARGWCLEVHDLAISKLAAARPKDLAFVEALIRRGYARVVVLRERLAATPGLAGTTRSAAKAWLEARSQAGRA
jgi:hypothetical protein